MVFPWMRETLKPYLELKNSIPSHDTMQRVFTIIQPEELQSFRSPVKAGLKARLF